MKNFISLNKILFYSLSIISIITLTYSFYQNDINDLELITYILILNFLILIFCFIFIIKEKIEYYPINVFFNLYLLISLIFFTYNFNYSFTNIYFGKFYSGFPDEKIDFSRFVFLSKEAIKILISTLLFLNLGFLLVTKIFKNKKINLFQNLNDTKLTKLNFLLIIIKFLFFFTQFFFHKNIPQLVNPINLLIVGISFYSLVIFKKHKLINICIILFIFFENIFLTYAIYKNIILLILCFIIIYHLKKKISFFLLILLVSWVFFGQSFKFDVRQNIKSSEEKFNQSSYYELIQNSQYQSRPIKLRLTEPIISLIRIIEFEKIKKKNIKKDTLSIIKFSLIPRIIYPDKPIQNFAKWYTSYFFKVYQNDPSKINSVTYNIFWPSDFYINFQYFGSTVLAFVIGFFLCILSYFFTNHNLSNIQYLLGLSIVSGFTFPEYNFSLMLSPIFLQILILFIMIKVLIYFIK